MKAPCNKIKYNNTEVSLILLNQYCWSMLNEPQYRPPQIFLDMFEKSYENLKDQDYFFRKSIHMNERWSTVEFSDGKTTFTLPFIYACFVQTILEKGPMTQADLCKILEISESLGQQALEFLFRAKIFQKNEDQLIYFSGPPSNAINDDDNGNEEHKLDKHSELELDPIYYSDCNDQIQASILRFLKKERFAFEDKIIEVVYQLVPSHFPVTNEKIKKCLEKLLELGYIIHQGTKTNSYRYCRNKI